MAVRVSQRPNTVSMTDSMKLTSICLLSIALFFSVLFLGGWNMVYGQTGLESTDGDRDLLLYFICTIALTVATIAMEVYYIKHRTIVMLKYAVIVANAALLGLMVHQLMKGSNDLFDSGHTHESDERSVLYTYASLYVGFAGVGTLLCIIHNFQGLVGTI